MAEAELVLAMSRDDKTFDNEDDHDGTWIPRCRRTRPTVTRRPGAACSSGPGVATVLVAGLLVALMLFDGRQDEEASVPVRSPGSSRR